MDSHLYDNNLLIQYLLGGLSEAQVEEFDELSIIDDEFASQLGEVENDLIDAYVRGELTRQAQAQFESRYLTSPRRREKVKFAQSLQNFAEIRKQAKTTEPTAIVAENLVHDTPITEQEATRPIVTETVPWWRALGQFFTVPNLTLQWGLAATALLLFLIGGWLIFETLRLRGQVGQAEAERAATQQREKDLQAQLEQKLSANAKDAEQLKEELKRTQEKLAQLEREQQLAKAQPPQDNPKIVSADLTLQTRSSGTDITIPVGTDYVVLHLELDDVNYPAYRAELLTQADDQRLWRSGTLKMRMKGQSKIVAVSVRANLLTPRGYSIVLKGITANGKEDNVRDYSFRVVRQ